MTSDSHLLKLQLSIQARCIGRGTQLLHLYYKKVSVFVNWLWLQVSIYFSLPFTCDNIFFKRCKKGESSKSFRCWNIKETVHSTYIVKHVFWKQHFNTWIQVLTVSPGQRHDLWGKLEWQWWFHLWCQKFVGRFFIYSLLTGCELSLTSFAFTLKAIINRILQWYQYVKKLLTSAVYLFELYF